MITKDFIGSGELWYDRDKVPRQQQFSFDPKFFQKIEECFLNIERLYKRPYHIILAGVYVDKPGAHGLGRALGLDGIEFEDGQLWSAKDRTRLTAAIQGIFMKKFGVVLGWTYDSKHEDHIHIDDYGYPWGFSDRPSIVKYVQWILNLEGRGSLKVDGIWGPRTQDSFVNYNNTAHDGRAYPTNTEYKDFLSGITSKFFSQMKREHHKQEHAIEGLGRLEMMEALEKIRDLAAGVLQEGDLS